MLKFGVRRTSGYDFQKAQNAIKAAAEVETNERMLQTRSAKAEMELGLGKGRRRGTKSGRTSG